MRNVALDLSILLILVSSTHTKWQNVICEEKYKVDWCLSKPHCVTEFLNCNCIPLAVFEATDTVPDTLSLCMMAFLWGVSEPVCCASDKKRSQSSRIYGAGKVEDDLLFSLLLENMQKRNFNGLTDDIINNDGELKSANRLIDTIDKNPFSSGSDRFDAYLNSFPKQNIKGTDTGLYPIQKKVASFNDVFLKSLGTSQSALTNTADVHSKQKLRETRTNSLTRYKARSIQSGFGNAYQSLDDAYPSFLEKSSAIVNENADPIDIVAKNSYANQGSKNVFRSKLLRVLKCLREGDKND